MSILKVLTPSEIEMYTYCNKQEVGEALAVGGEDIHYGDDPSGFKQEQNNHQAKIIPLNEAVEHQLKNIEPEFVSESAPEESTLSDDLSRQGTRSSNSLNELGILSASQIREIEEQKKRDQYKNKDSASVFIINQRDKFKQSRLRLIEQKAIFEYQKNSNTEILTKHITNEDSEEAECVENTFKGILLNKKHY